MRTAQNSSPGFCAAGVDFGKVSLRAQCDPAPVKIVNRRGSVLVVKELVYDGGLEPSRLRGQFQQLFLATD
jgi:hypothetical protein